ncbi:MAG: biotin transporter BioY [Clostridia bacterium]|nr:biotin transporter BioY [Clostridia bacterium]
MNNTFTAKNLALCGVLLCFLCISSKLAIPTPIAPFSLQFACILLCILLLGARLAAITIALYILLGLMGLPVFASGGGLSYIVNPSFGYILGFLLACFTVSIVYSKNKTYTLKKLWLTSVIVLITVHVSGLSYAYLINRFYLKSAVSIANLLVYGSLIFIPIDLIWCAIIPPICTKLPIKTIK